MGIKIFYIGSIIYGIISGLGFFARGLKTPCFYIFPIIIGTYLLFYILRKKIEFYHSIIGGIMTNLSVQLTGGFNSPLFLLYLLVLPLIGHKDKYKNYWIISGFLICIELASGIFRNKILIPPLIILVIAISVFGVVIERAQRYNRRLEKSLVKYETRDKFFSPANLGSKSVITSIADIDRHPGIERPLLYFVKFVHNIFNAYTTAIFSYNDNKLVLIQGFSHSELFCTDTVLEIKSGIYRQVITEKRSLLIKEFFQNPEELGYYKGELKVASVLIAPICLLDQIEGIFVIDRKAQPFTEEDKELFTEATKSVGFLLAMLRLYEKERYEAQYLSSVATLAQKFQLRLELEHILSDTIKSFKDVMKCDDISIASIDELNNQGVVLKSTYVKENTKFSLDDGLVGIIGRHKNYILKDDTGKGKLVVLKKGVRSPYGSFLGVPVREDDEILGVVWLEDHRRKRFHEDDIRALNILVAQLSLAWQRANLFQRIKELSIRDGLTGLYNHRHFQEMLEREIKKRRELDLLLFDIDHFKKINDTYGHQAGDEVLKFLGRLISKTGIAARYGGEEFAIILPGCSIKKGIDQAVRIKDHLLKSEIKFKLVKIKFTVSIGIAHYPRDATTRVGLIEMADRALYRAKETGRNKIVVAQSLSTSGSSHPIASGI